MTNTTSAVLKTDCLGRVKVSTAHREAVLDEFESSGMSGLAFARLHGIKYPTFASWIQKRRRERGDYLKRSSAGMATESHPEPAPNTSTALTLAEVVVEQPSCSAPPSPLSLRVREDLRIECSDRSQIPLLVELLEALNPSTSC